MKNAYLGNFLHYFFSTKISVMQVCLLSNSQHMSLFLSPTIGFFKVKTGQLTGILQAEASKRNIGTVHYA